jgi:hypothetical protein
MYRSAGSCLRSTSGVTTAWRFGRTCSDARSSCGNGAALEPTGGAVWIRFPTRVRRRMPLRRSQVQNDGEGIGIAAKSKQFRPLCYLLVCGTSDQHTVDFQPVRAACPYRLAFARKRKSKSERGVFALADVAAACLVFPHDWIFWRGLGALWLPPPILQAVGGLHVSSRTSTSRNARS